MDLPKTCRPISITRYSDLCLEAVLIRTVITICCSRELPEALWPDDLLRRTEIETESTEIARGETGATEIETEIEATEIEIERGVSLEKEDIEKEEEIETEIESVRPLVSALRDIIVVRIVTETEIEIESALLVVKETAKTETEIEIESAIEIVMAIGGACIVKRPMTSTKTIITWTIKHKTTMATTIRALRLTTAVAHLCRSLQRVY